MWTDVTVRPNGQLVTINGDGTRVFLSTGGYVPCPAVHLRCAATDAVIAVAGQATTGDTVLVVNDRGDVYRHASIVHGVQAIGISADDANFSVAWMTDGGRMLSVVSLDGRLTERYSPFQLPAPVMDFTVPMQVMGTSQGLLDWPPPVWTDDQRIVTIDGVRYTLWMRRGDWTVGQGQDVGGVIAFNYATKTHHRVTNIDTQLPPRIAVRPDGSALVAVSADGGLFIESRDFTPLVPSVPVPTLEKASHRYRVVTFDKPGQAERLTWVSSPDGPGDPSPGDAGTVGVFVTVGRDRIVEAETVCRHYRYPLFAYVDGPSYPASKVPIISGVKVIPTVQCYPRANENIVSAAARIMVTLNTLAMTFKELAVVPAFYTIGQTIPLVYVLDLIAHVHAYVLRLKIRWVLPYLWTRNQGRDGIVAYPELQQMLAQFEAENGVDAPTPTPQPVPKPVPIPVPPVNEDDMPIYSDEIFQKYIDAAAPIVAPFMPAGIDAKQGARGMGDKFRSRGHNPTVMELAAGTYMMHGKGRNLTDEELNVIAPQAIAAQELLRRP